MKTFNRNIKRYFNFNKNESNNKDLINSVFINNGNYIYCNKYSIIVMPISADKNNYKRLKELEGFNIYDFDKYKFRNTKAEQKISNLNTTILDYINYFKEDSFCSLVNNIDLNNIQDEYLSVGNINTTFNIKMIKNIQKIINGKAIYTSEKNNQAISLTGKNGYAYLLGAIKY